MGKIYKVDFADEADSTRSISELFESIQLYRREGKSLSKIHAAFCQSGLWKTGLSSFSNQYYQHRAEQQVSGEASKQKPSTAAKATKHQTSPQPTKDTADDTAGKVSSQVDSRPVVRPDMTLAEKRAFSAEIFRRRREGQ